MAPSLQTTAESTGICSSSSCDVQGGSVVCRCLNVTESEIQTAISAFNVQTLRELGRCTGAGKGCMSCHGRLKALIINQQG